MGQKVNPTGIRIGITKQWAANWYAATDKEYSANLIEDLKVRQLIYKRLRGAAISHIQIDRPAKNVKIAIHSARPGVIIGKKGGDVDNLKKQFNYKPSTSVIEGVSNFVAWYKRHYQND